MHFCENDLLDFCSHDLCRRDENSWQSISVLIILIWKLFLIVTGVFSSIVRILSSWEWELLFWNYFFLKKKNGNCDFFLIPVSGLPNGSHWSHAIVASTCFLMNRFCLVSTVSRFFFLEFLPYTHIHFRWFIQYNL